MAVSEQIKKCAYCGRENLAVASNCRECGTSFEQEQIRDFLPTIKTLAAKSTVAFAVATGLAAFLIVTGVYCAAGRASVEQMPIPTLSVSPEDQTLYASKQVISYSSTEVRVLVLGAIVFTVVLCWTRLQKKWQAILVAAATLGIMTAIRFFPECLILVPAFAVGMTLDSPTLFRLIAALQIIVGALLLFWFRRQKVR